MPAIPNAAWQKTASFPDWKGEPDNSLAMNSMISFFGYHGQGALWLDANSNGKKEWMDSWTNGCT